MTQHNFVATRQTCRVGASLDLRAKTATEARPAAREIEQIVEVEGLVRSRGLEPPRLAALTPQASASTNSATTARHGMPWAPTS